MNVRFLAWTFLASLFVLAEATATDILVTNEAEFAAALSSAQDGDRILLAPGTYNGGFFQSGLYGVTIRSQFENNPAIISGGTNAIQLSDATMLTIEHLICEGQTGNGLNIDDGGSFETPSSDVTLRNIIVRDMNANGNNDGIKLSGVTGFVISGVQVTNWGEGGSAVDTVGSHNGLIQNSFFHHDAIGSVGSGIRPKGGSKNIIIRANRLELPGTNGRAIQAGGSTGAQFFRFIDGDSGYEADEIRVEGNVVVNGSSSFSFVNIDGGHFHHNYAYRPDDWLIRILNENQGNSIVDTKNGLLEDNVMVFNDTGTEFNTAVNIGPETEPATFMFLRNQWYNIADPANSVPNLPSTEIGGIYGLPPQYDIDDAIGWQFDWGQWIVNANNTANSFFVATPADWLLATATNDATFDPLSPNPFLGDWTFNDLSSGSVQVPPWSQTCLLSETFRVDPQGRKLLDGVVVAGQLSDVFESNDIYLDVDPSPTQNLIKQKVDIIFQSEANTADPASFSFRVESKMAGGPSGDVIQTINLWNYQNGSWELFDTRSAATVDELIQINPANDVTRFLQPITNEMTAKVTWKSESFSGMPFVWTVEIDEATWLVID